MKHITVYTFVILILGGDSPEKTLRHRLRQGPDRHPFGLDAARRKPPSPPANCDAGLIERNLALPTRSGQRHAGHRAARMATASQVPWAPWSWSGACSSDGGKS